MEVFFRSKWLYSFFPSPVRFFPSSSIMDQNWPFRLNPKRGIFFPSYSTPFFLFLNSTMMSIKTHHVQCLSKCIFEMNGHFRVSIFHGIAKDPLLLEEWVSHSNYVPILRSLSWFFPFLFVEEYLMRSNKIYDTGNTWMNCIVKESRHDAIICKSLHYWCW